MASDPELHRAKILVVDDEHANVRLLERLLGNEGYTVVGVTDSSSLFADPATLDGADLVLLDLHMPPPDGFEILEQLVGGDSRGQLPVLVLTGDLSAASRNRALSMGANDYINKPFDPVEVLLRVRNLLQMRFVTLRLLKANRVLQDQLLQAEADRSRTAQQEPSG